MNELCLHRMHKDASSHPPSHVWLLAHSSSTRPGELEGGRRGGASGKGRRDSRGERLGIAPQSGSTWNNLKCSLWPLCVICFLSDGSPSPSVWRSAGYRRAFIGSERERENASFFYPVVSCLLYSYALALMILWDEGKSRSDLTGHITGWNNYLFPKMVDFLVVTH